MWSLQCWSRRRWPFPAVLVAPPVRVPPPVAELPPVLVAPPVRVLPRSPNCRPCWSRRPCAATPGRRFRLCWWCRPLRFHPRRCTAGRGDAARGISASRRHAARVGPSLGGSAAGGKPATAGRVAPAAASSRRTPPEAFNPPSRCCAPSTRGTASCRLSAVCSCCRRCVAACTPAAT